MKVGGALACLAAALLLGLAGCGDDDDDGGSGTAAETTTTEARITKAVFIREADEICTDYRKRVFDLQRQIDGTNDTGKQADLIREVADEAEGILAEFDALGTPAGDEQLFADYKSTGRQQIALIRRAADALAQGDTAEARRLIESGQATGAELRGIAQGYGFKVCGKGE